MQRRTNTIALLYFVLYVVFTHVYNASDSMNLSEALPTKAIDTVRVYTPKHNRPVREGLAQGPYIAARAGFKQTTLRSKGINSTNAPPRLIVSFSC